jgi:hypothetical protein
MFVTGVQSVGSKGVNSVQVAAVDIKEVSRLGALKERESEPGTKARPGDPQPVVFPRSGSLPLDQRPESLRRHQAATRYLSDGGDDGDGRDPDRDAA